MQIKMLLEQMVKLDGSDMFLRPKGLPRIRLHGKIIPFGEKILEVEDLMGLVEELTNLRQRELFKNNFDIDFAYYMPELDRRFRISIFAQRNYPSIVIRNVRNYISTFEELNLPTDALEKLAMETRGLVLLTGSTGSGKSTTLFSMIDYINTHCNKHILTLEEPIEYTFTDKNSVINQRELGLDVSSYSVALRAFTLQSPDVIYIANIRDLETMSAALTAAETGVLVLSTLHTINAAQTVERIVNFFPPYQHQQIRTQLSYLLKGVISLRLLPLKGQTGRVPAYEVMLLTPTISRLIREGKVLDMPQFIEEGSIFGMQSFSQSLIRLVNEGKISEEDAIRYSDNKDEFSLALRGIKRGN